MNTNDYLGSWADENVSFSTRIVKTAKVGDNFWTAMVFVEDARYVTLTQAGWEDAPGVETSLGVKVLAVDATTYAQYTKDVLQSWLYDLFCNGFTGTCILVACGAVTDATITYEAVTPETGDNPAAKGWYVQDGTDYVLTTDTEVQTGTTYYNRVSTGADASAFITKMDAAYAVLRPYAYFKTSCCGEDGLNADVAVELSKLCATDKNLLSAAPLYPVTKLDPANDTLYSAIKASGSAQDAFMSYHSDITRNGALYSLGLALRDLNESGTVVGNGFDAIASTDLPPSGPNGTNIGASNVALVNANVQYFKTVGDNTLSVAAYGAKTINGDVYTANWILAYITYMTKVRVAQFITSGNVLKNAASYSRCVNILTGQILMFVNSGRLKDHAISAPAFSALPEADGETIIIPDAWSATYVDNLRKVQITGSLYIGA